MYTDGEIRELLYAARRGVCEAGRTSLSSWSNKWAGPFTVSIPRASSKPIPDRISVSAHISGLDFFIRFGLVFTFLSIFLIFLRKPKNFKISSFLKLEQNFKSEHFLIFEIFYNLNIFKNLNKFSKMNIFHTLNFFIF
jgi:hypothetical protein